MKPILLVARTEAIEHLRQRSMLAIIAMNYVFWTGLFSVLLFVFDRASRIPEVQQMFEQQAALFGVVDANAALGTMTTLLNSSLGTVLFTNLSLFVALMAANSVMHDRSSGTLAFLMLAPLSRYQLLLGKVLGGLAVPTVMHLIFVGGSSLLVRQISIMEPLFDYHGSSAAWWVVYIFSAPALAFLIGCLGTTMSALARDIRTALQFTSFFVGILSVFGGIALFHGIEVGAGAQLALGGGCVAAGLVVLFVGSRIISRDIAA